MNSLLLLALLAAQPSDPWTPSQLIQPAALAEHLAAKPKIFYVGFPVLYRSKHIPGAVLEGPASKPEVLAELKQALARVPRSQEVVIYCGCCPWDHCPNIRPAARLLQEMGFKNARILFTPTNFLKDWVEKGYPFETGAR